MHFYDQLKKHKKLDKSRHIGSEQKNPTHSSGDKQGSSNLDFEFDSLHSDPQLSLTLSFGALLTLVTKTSSLYSEYKTSGKSSNTTHTHFCTCITSAQKGQQLLKVELTNGSRTQNYPSSPTWRCGLGPTNVLDSNWCHRRVS